MRARTASVGDLELVFHDLSARLSREYAASGVKVDVMHDKLMMDLKEGRAHALVEGGDVLAIIAWHENDDVGHTLFAAMDKFFRASTVRFCRRHIQKVQSLTGNLPIRHRSWIDHAEVGKWFRILGFKVRSKSQSSTVYELAPVPFSASQD